VRLGGAVAKELDGTALILVLESLSKKYGQHSFAFPRPAIDPDNAGLILQPALVRLIFENPLADSRDPYTLSVDQTLAVEQGIRDEKSFTTSRGGGLASSSMVVWVGSDMAQQHGPLASVVDVPQNCALALSLTIPLQYS
jgi:hypothetical protein